MEITNNFSATALQFAPGVHIFLRDKDQIQIGLNPSNSLQLPAQLHGLLKKCDGFTTVQQILDLAELKQLDPKSIAQILKLLVSQNLLNVTDPKINNLTRNQQSHHLDASRAINGDSILVNQRANIRLDIVGGGRIGNTLALILGNSGFSNLRVFDSTPVKLHDLTPWGFSRLDVGLRRDYVIQTMLERIHRGQLKSMRSKESRTKPDLIIYAPDPVADWPWFDPSLTDWALEIDVPFMAITSSATNSIVTSVINAGVAGCIRCFHLHQADRDSAWPRLVSQLIGKQIPDPTPTNLVLRTALQAYEQISHWLAKPETLSGSWQSITETGQISQFNVPPHSECGCLWGCAQSEVS